MKPLTDANLYDEAIKYENDPEVKGVPFFEGVFVGALYVNEYYRKIILKKGDTKMSQKEITTAIVKLIESAEILIENNIDPVYVVTELFKKRIEGRKE